MENPTSLMKYTVKNETDGKTYQVILPKGASLEEIQAEAARHVDEINKPSILESTLAGAGQGIGFNSLDEMYGAVKGGYKALKEGKNFSGEGGEYRKARDEARDYFDKVEKANPNAYMIGELGGSLAVPMGVEGAAVKYGSRFAPKIAAKLAPEAQTLGRSIADNAVYSGVAGYGGANSDDNSTAIAEGLGSAGVGAGFGGLLHGAGTVAKQLIPRRLDPEGFHAEKFAEANLRDMGKTKFTRGENPLQNIEDRLQAEAERGNTDLIASDFAGENLKGYIRNAYDTPNPNRQRYKEVLDRRVQVNSRKIQDSLKENLGVSKNYYKSIEDLDKQMTEVSKPFFEQAKKIDTPMTPELEEILSRPLMSKIEDGVRERIQNRPKSKPTSRIDYLHMIKERLDAEIGVAANQLRHQATLPQPAGGAESLLIDLKDLKSEFLNAIKNPYYKEGLRRYAGKATLQNALEAGHYDISRLAPEQIQSALADLSVAEQDAYREGAVRAIVDKLKKAGKPEVDRTRIVRNEDMADKIQVLFNTKEGAKLSNFLKDVAVTELKHETRHNAQGNSVTNKLKKAGEDAEKNADIIDTVSDVAGAAGGSLSSGASLVKKITKYLSGDNAKRAAGTLDLSMRGAGELGNIGNQVVENALRRDLNQRRVQNALAGPFSQISSGIANSVADDQYDGRSYNLYNR